MNRKTWQVWTEENEGYFNTVFEGTERQVRSYYRSNNKNNNLHIGYEISDNQFFSETGEFITEFPEDCIKECSASGDVSESVKQWVLKLDFFLPSLSMGRKYLSEFGAWDDLDQADMFTLSQRVLWLACGDIEESGEWLGLIH